MIRIDFNVSADADTRPTNGIDNFAYIGVKTVWSILN